MDTNASVANRSMISVLQEHAIWMTFAADRSLALPTLPPLTLAGA